jgi:16S rRNA processing protein RimM
VNVAAERQPSVKDPGSGEQRRASEPRFLAVGQIVGAHGICGELKVKLLTQDPQRFGKLERVLVGLEGQEPVPWPLEAYRLHKGQALLKLAQCNDRNTAETLRGYLVLVPLEEAIPLEEDEYYEHQIVDLDVWTVTGEHLGQVVDILYTGANEVYIVRPVDPHRREILIPAIADVIVKVDLEASRLVVELPAGLL